MSQKEHREDQGVYEGTVVCAKDWYTGTQEGGHTRGRGFERICLRRYPFRLDKKTRKIFLIIMG